DDHHRVPAGAPAREGRRVVAGAPELRPDVLAQVAAALQRPDLGRGLRRARGDLDVVARREHAEEAPCVRSAARPGDADDDFALHGATLALTRDATPSVRSAPCTR